MYTVLAIIVLLVVCGAIVAIQHLVYRTRLKDEDRRLQDIFIKKAQQEDKEKEEIIKEIKEETRQEIRQVEKSVFIAEGRFDRIQEENSRLKREIEERKTKYLLGINTQRAVIKGNLAEKMVKLSENCPYSLSNMFPASHPLDWIIINGYSEEAEEFEIIFAEIKTGKARLNKNEKKIKRAIEAGRIKYKTFRVSVPLDIKEE